MSQDTQWSDHPIDMEQIGPSDTRLRSDIAFERHFTIRVHSDVLERMQESRGRLEVEIRKLLHEISRIAEQAVERARKTKEEGVSAVDTALGELDRLERTVSTLTQ